MKKIIAFAALALGLAARAVETSDYITVLNLDFETESAISASITGGYVPDATISIDETISNQPTYSQAAWVNSESVATGDHFLLMSRPISNEKYGAYIDFAASAATAGASLSSNYELEFDCNLGGGYKNASYMVIEGVDDALFYISIPGNQSTSWGEYATLHNAESEQIADKFHVRSRGQAVPTAPADTWYHIKAEGVVGDGVYITITRPNKDTTILTRTKVSDFAALSQLRFVLSNTKQTTNPNPDAYTMETALDNLVLKALPSQTLAEEPIAETSDGYAAVSIPSEKTPGETTSTTLDASKTWSSLGGVGRVASAYDQTIHAGGDGSFVGAFTGAMKLTLTGTGTYSVLGESSNTGGFDVQGGTLKFALPTSLSGVAYHLDASRADTISTVTDSEEIERLQWSDALGGTHTIIAKPFSDGTSSHARGSVNATATTAYFGGRTSLYSDNFRMVHDAEGEYQSSVFAVFTLVATSTYRIMEDSSDASGGSRWYAERNSSTGGYRSYINGDDSRSAYIGVNGAIGGTASVGTATVVSIPYHWSRHGSNSGYGSRKIAYGRGNEMAWAEIISMNRPVTLEEQKAVDAFLMGKWGIAAYQPLGTGAVTVGANGTLDANNVYATLASLNLAGTLANPTNLTVTGAATFTAGATIEVALPGDAAVGTKILSCGSASGLENLTVKVNGVALTGLKPKFKTDGIYLGRVGFVIIIADSDVTIDEVEDFNTSLEPSGHDINAGLYNRLVATVAAAGEYDDFELWRDEIYSLIP